MSAFVSNTNGQYLSQRAGQVTVETSHVETGVPIKVNFWRWQFWNERGAGEWDSVYLSPGNARELAYGILAELGKVKNDGEKEAKSEHSGPGSTSESSSSTGS